MDLFGRKERIEELEATVSELEDRIDDLIADRDRYREKFQHAETRKQEADEKRKQAEQRIQTLESRIEEDTTRERKQLSADAVATLIDDLDTTTFGDPDAYSAYLPADDAVITERDEIIFFDPYTTATVLVPPVPVDHEVASERMFRLDQLQSLLNGPYCYLHCSTDGAGVARIVDQEVTETVLPDGADPAAITDTAETVRQADETVLVAGDEQLADAVYNRLSGAVRVQSKVVSIDREQDLSQAFASAFTFERIRLTADDIDRVKAEQF